MKNVYLFILLLLPLLGNAQSREADSLALVQLYNDLGGMEWVKGENWLSEAPLEDWEGISTLSDRVWKVELKQFGVVGDFPISILQLSELSAFEINGGTINGSIPEGLASLDKLRTFKLASCSVSGGLPDDFDQYSALQTCILTNNNLSGPLPTLLPNTITYINWKGNQFSGGIPASWQDADLTWITMSNNLLEGDYDVLQYISTLGHIDMSNNNWEEKSFPEWVDDLENLSWFACESCNLVGDLPESLDFSDRLSHDRVLINDNKLSGDISLLFSGINSARGVYLRARNNSFAGEFPAHSVITANQIDVRGNNYSSISEFGEISFDRLDLSGNQFTFSSLDPIKSYILVDTIIGVIYDNQEYLLTSDTLTISESTVVTLDAGETYPNTTYEWIKNNQIMEGEIDAQLTMTIDEANDSGIYYCKIRNAEFPELELRRNSIKINWETSTHVEDVETLDISIYPNPTTDHITINLMNDNQRGSFQIVNNVGKILKQGSIENQEHISLQDLKSGWYYFTLSMDSKLYTKKLNKI